MRRPGGLEVSTHVRGTPWRVIVVTAVLTVAGCSGMKPYDPPDYRDNPPGPGILSGDEGEFVIYRKRRESPPTPKLGRCK